MSLLWSIEAEHSWTSPVDVARLLIEVASSERAWGRAWHVPTNAPRTQHQVIDDLADAAGVPHVRVSHVNGQSEIPVGGQVMSLSADT